MAEQNAPQNDKVKELLAQLRATFDMEDAAPGAAFSSHNQADAFSESGETDENDENGFPNEFNGAQVCPADNDDAVKGGEDGALKGEGAQRNLETDDSLEDEGFFQVESLDTAEASPQTTNLSEAENLSKTESGLQMEKASETSPAAYYQFSILGDLDTAPMPFPRGYNDDEDGTETFIIRPAVVPAGSVPSALGQDGSEENALTQEERFDPNRPTLDESGEDSAFTDEISTCDVHLHTDPDEQEGSKDESFEKGNIETGDIASLISQEVYIRKDESDTQTDGAAASAFQTPHDTKNAQSDGFSSVGKDEDTFEESNREESVGAPLNREGEKQECDSRENSNQGNNNQEGNQEDNQESENTESAFAPSTEDSSKACSEQSSRSLSGYEALIGDVIDCSERDDGDDGDGLGGSDTDFLGESPYDEKEAPTDYGIPIDPQPYRSEYGDKSKTVLIETPKKPSVVSADTTSRGIRVTRAEGSEGKSPRVRIAPEAYRFRPTVETVKNVKPIPDNKAHRVVTAQNEMDDDADNFLNSLPDAMRRAIGDHPLGRIPFVQKEKDAQQEDKPKKKKKVSEEARLRALFPEERAEEYDSRTKYSTLHARLVRESRLCRLQLVIVSVLALFILALECLPFLFPNVLEAVFVEPSATAYAECVLLCVILFASAKHVRVGVHGLFHRRVVPESLAVIELLAAVLYNLVFAMLKIKVVNFSFAAALCMVFLVYFRAMHAENRLSVFSFITANGDKLVFTQIPKKKARAEANALGKNLDQECASIYRIRKTAFVEEFSARTGTVCEDFTVNLVLLFCVLGVSLLSFGVSLATEKVLSVATAAAFFTLSLGIPVSMCASHIYPMRRTLGLAGEDATVVGEVSLRECGKLDAVAFEDVEAIPSKNVKISHMKIYAGDLSTVLHYVISLLHEVGGPLYGHFVSALKKGEHFGETKLLESTAGGIAATVEGADLLLGNEDYMLRHKLMPEKDKDDAAALAGGRATVMYVAVNGCICAKFYVSYSVSASFESTVRRLNKLGIATVIRTYDPNLSEAFLLRISSLGDCRVHVVNKTVSQLGDFGAVQMPAGFVTSSHSGKLMRVLFLGLRARRALAFQKILKIVCAAAGMAAGFALSVFFGLHNILPSAVLGLWQMLWLLLAVLSVRLAVRPQKTAEGKQNESSKNIRNP